MFLYLALEWQLSVAEFCSQAFFWYIITSTLATHPWQQSFPEGILSLARPTDRKPQLARKVNFENVSREKKERGTKRHTMT